MSKQAFTSYYEEMSGIKVTYNHYIGSDIFVLTQTMMSSGNLPDIFISVPVGFTCAKVAQYGQEGYFADLTGKLQTVGSQCIQAAPIFHPSLCQIRRLRPGQGVFPAVNLPQRERGRFGEPAGRVSADD